MTIVNGWVNFERFLLSASVGCLRLIKIRKNVWFSYSIKSEEIFQRKVKDFCNFAPFFM